MIPAGDALDITKFVESIDIVTFKCQYVIVEPVELSRTGVTVSYQGHTVDVI